MPSKRAKTAAAATGPALPQQLLEAIACYVTLSSTFFAVLDALPRAGRSSFLTALDELAYVCPPDLLWPALRVGDAALASTGHEALLERVLKSHTLVLMSPSDPIEYFEMLSPTASVFLNACDAKIENVDAAILARVTHLGVNMINKSCCLRSVAVQVANAPRLRALMLGLDVQELADDEALGLLQANTRATLRSTEIWLTSSTDSEPLNEVTARAVAQTIASFPVTRLFFNEVRATETGAKMLYDAMIDAPRLNDVEVLSSSDLARAFAAFGRPWTCQRRHEHDDICIARANAAKETVFPQITSWRLQGVWSEMRSAIPTLQAMDHLRSLRLFFQTQLSDDEFDDVLAAIAPLPLRTLALGGVALLSDPNRVQRLLSMLEAKSSITTLRLRMAGLTIYGLDVTSSLLRHLRQLEYLDIGNNALTDDAVPQLLTLIMSSNVHAIRLSNNDLSDDAMDSLHAFRVPRGRCDLIFYGDRFFNEM
ncbi:hypothetical protein SPRG_02585 [Saprolegnia parasitica CBS 223.65]|uniref:Uncharacterized protein n=1 Tax=Saprolegnia parasitica (strain CBS 223.65) TaxID=695850 RepID=A0A067CQB2_SAPPC|nr:hypothetical protein SPRG_02585 [Saprolegnia parasitica CBS 223.65]KDO32894.1 hypothetical protein SPRG_02585 [Saprolegnia parasitica CBS 223.65]|eukprot:XP_012196544.1 hypothetical protein SPRG_02585 [Saprolegnia parasitica CBS 223.65]